MRRGGLKDEVREVWYLVRYVRWHSCISKLVFVTDDARGAYPGTDSTGVGRFSLEALSPSNLGMRDASSTDKFFVTRR